MADDSRTRSEHDLTEGSGTQRSQAPVAVWVRESSAEGYIEGEIIEWPMDGTGEPSQEVVFVLVRGRSLEVHPDDILERDDLGHTVEGLGLWRGEKGDLLEADFNPTLVNEAEVLAHVLSRLRADEPYTKAGPHTLVCVNSHKWLPLPSGDEQFRQRVSRSGADAVLPATALGVVVSTATANAPQSPRSPSETDEGGGLVSGAAAAGGGEGSNNSNNPSTSPLGGLGCGDRSLLALPPHPYVEAKAALLRVAPLGPHASAVDRPQLFVMAGGPGSGKSHTAKMIIHFITASSVPSPPPPGGLVGGASPPPLLSPAVVALAAGPALLDMFGSTPKAHKSSRFGSLVTMYIDAMGQCCGGSLDPVVPLDCSPIDAMALGGALFPPSSSSSSSGLLPLQALKESFPIFACMASLLPQVPFVDSMGGGGVGGVPGLRPTLPFAQAHLLLLTLSSSKGANTAATAGAGGAAAAAADPNAPDSAMLAALAKEHSESFQRLLDLFAKLQLSLEEKQAALDLATAIFALARGAPSHLVAELLGMPAVAFEGALAEAGEGFSSSSGRGGSSSRGVSSERGGSRGRDSSSRGRSSDRGGRGGGGSEGGCLYGGGDTTAATGAAAASLALARVLHRTLFDWLVACSNEVSLPQSVDNNDNNGDDDKQKGFRLGRTISVLDLAGLDGGSGGGGGFPSSPEAAAVLGFEGLVANSAVEVLAEYFHAQAHTATAAAAIREGCVLPSSSSSSSSSSAPVPALHTPCVSLLLAQPHGLLPSILGTGASASSATALSHDASRDSSLVSRWANAFPMHDHFQVANTATTATTHTTGAGGGRARQQQPLLFTVRHTACPVDVTYSARGLARRGAESASPSASGAAATLPLRLRSLLSDCAATNSSSSSSGSGGLELNLILKEKLGGDQGVKEKQQEADAAAGTHHALRSLEDTLGRLAEEGVDARFIVCLNPGEGGGSGGGAPSAEEEEEEGQEGLRLLRQVRASGLTPMLVAHRNGFTSKVRLADLCAGLLPLLELHQSSSSLATPTERSALARVQQVLLAQEAAVEAEAAAAGDTSAAAAASVVLQGGDLEVSAADRSSLKALAAKLLSTPAVVAVLGSHTKNEEDDEDDEEEEAGENNSAGSAAAGGGGRGGGGGGNVPWVLGVDSAFLRAGAVDALARLRLSLLSSLACRIQRTCASPQKNWTCHEAKLARAHTEGLSTACMAWGLGNALSGTAAGTAGGDSGGGLVSDSLRKLEASSLQALSLERAQKGAGALMSFRAPVRVAEDSVLDGVARRCAFDALLSDAGTALAQAAGRLASVRAALVGVEQQQQQGAKKGSAATESSSSSPALRSETSTARRHLGDVAPKLASLKRQLQELKNTHALRSAGRHVLDFPLPSSRLDSLLAQSLDALPDAWQGLPAVDLDADAQAAASLTAKVGSELEDGLVKCEDSVGALLDLVATQHEQGQAVREELAVLHAQHRSLELAVDRLGVRTDPTVSGLLRDCAEAVRTVAAGARGVSGGGGGGGLDGGGSRGAGLSLQGISAALRQVQAASEVAERVATAQDERKTFDGVVSPMLASLRRRVDSVHADATPTVAAFRQAPSSGFSAAAAMADDTVGSVEALLHQVGQAETCVRLLGAASDSVTSLEKCSAACRSKADGVEREKQNCRRRLLPAQDAMRRLTKRMELDDGSSGSGIGGGGGGGGGHANQEASLAARQSAVDAMDSAKAAIEAHGSYASHLSLSLAYASSSSSSSGGSGGEAVERSREEEERALGAAAVAGLEREVDKAIRLVAAAERLHVSEGVKRAQLLQESSAASARLTQLESQLAAAEADASRCPPPTSDLCSEATEEAAAALAGAPRRLRESRGLAELRRVVGSVEETVNRCLGHVDRCKDWVGEALRFRASHRSRLGDAEHRLRRAEESFKDCGSRFSDFEPRKGRGAEGGESALDSHSFSSSPSSNSSSMAAMRGMGAVAALAVRRAPLPSEDAAQVALNECRAALLLAHAAVERPLTAAALQVDGSGGSSRGSAAAGSGEQGLLVARASEKADGAEDAVAVMKRQVDSILRVSGEAEHRFHVLSRQLEATKERSAGAAGSLSSSSSSSSSSSYGGSAAIAKGEGVAPGAKALQAAENDLAAVRRLLLELRTGVGAATTTAAEMGGGDDDEANNNGCGSSSLHAQLGAALRTAVGSVTRADEVVEREVAQRALLEGCRTVALMRLNEVTMSLQGVLATVEASGPSVQALVGEELLEAKQAVQRAGAAVQDPSSSSACSDPDAEAAQAVAAALAAATAEESGSSPTSVSQQNLGSAGGGGSLLASSLVGGVSPEVDSALKAASEATTKAGCAVSEAVRCTSEATRELRKLRERCRSLEENAQVLAERAIRQDVHRNGAAVAALKALDVGVALALRGAHCEVCEYLRDPAACAQGVKDAVSRLAECEHVLGQVTASKKHEQALERQSGRELEVLQRRHARAVAQAEKWGVAGDGHVQQAFAATEEALGVGRATLNGLGGSAAQGGGGGPMMRHRLEHAKMCVKDEEALLVGERKRQEEAHFDVQRALLALPELKRRAAMLEASVGVSDVAVKELASQDLGELKEALSAFEGWLDFRGPDGQIHFTAARDGVVATLEQARRALKAAEGAVELHTQRVRTAKAEQGAERQRLAALETKLHSLTGDMAALAASAAPSSSPSSSFAEFSGNGGHGGSSSSAAAALPHLAPISEALGEATAKVAKARSLVEVPASDWVIMSLLSSGGGGGKERTGADGDDGDESDEEGPFAGLDGGCKALASAETAHQAVEAAAAAIAAAERALRGGERKAHAVVGERKRFEAQLQASTERFGGVLATAHASGVADWPDVAAGCEEAEEGLRRVRDILNDNSSGCGEFGGGGGSGSGGSVLMARAALDAVVAKVEAAEALVTDGWQRSEQQRAEAGAAAELCRSAIAMAADAKECAHALGLAELPAVALALEHSEAACEAAALSVSQRGSLPLAVVTDDCRRALEASQGLERCVETQRAAREHFEGAERQRTSWKRQEAVKKASAAQAKQGEDTRQLRSLRDQLEAVQLFLASKTPGMQSAVRSFEGASEAIEAAQRQLSEGGGVPSAVAASAVKAAVAAVEAAVAEQATANKETAATPTPPPPPPPPHSTRGGNDEDADGDNNNGGGGDEPVSSAASSSSSSSATAAFAARGRSSSPKNNVLRGGGCGSSGDGGGSGGGGSWSASEDVAAMNTELVKATLRVEQQQKVLTLQAEILRDMATFTPQERDAKIRELARLTDPQGAAEDI